MTDQLRDAAIKGRNKTSISTRDGKLVFAKHFSDDDDSLRRFGASLRWDGLAEAENWDFTPRILVAV